MCTANQPSLLRTRDADQPKQDDPLALTTFQWLLENCMLVETEELKNVKLLNYF